MRKGNIRVHNNFIHVFLSLLLVCFFFSVSSVKVSATGWVDRTDAVYEQLYGTPDMTGQQEAVAQPEEASWFEKIISDLIVNVSKGLNHLLSNFDIDLSIDGIVFGRMAATLSDSGYVKADFTHFGLEENNPWGIIGATVFYALRSICLVVLPIILLGLLILELFHNTGKGRARLKELAMHTVYVFGLLFILPYVLDLFIYFRDVVLYSVYNAMNSLVAGISGSSTEGKGLVEMMLEVQDGRILNALVLLASVCAGLFFLFDYIRIALLLTGAFGIFPIIAVMSFWNNKKLSEWSNVFFPNLLVPFIDMLLVMVPTILQALFTRIFGDGLSSILMGLIILIVIWNVVAVRNRIVKLLGFDGLGGGNNVGQMLETLSHLRHGKKEEKSSEKPEGEKKEEGSAAGTTTGFGTSSHYGDTNQAVDGVVNNETIDNGSADNTESKVDSYLNSMGGQNSEGGAVIAETQIADSEPAHVAASGGAEVANASATDEVLNSMEEPVMINPEPIPRMEEVPFKQSADHITAGMVDEMLSADRSAGVKAGNRAAAKVLLEGAGKVASKGAKAAGSAVVKGTRVVGAATLGTTAAVAAGYGGMGASVGAGIVGGHLGTKTPEAVAAGVDIYGEGKKKAKDAIYATYHGTFAVHDAYVEARSQADPLYGIKKKADQGVKDAKARNEALMQEVEAEFEKHNKA